MATNIRHHLVRLVMVFAVLFSAVTLLGVAARQPDDDDASSLIEATAVVSATGCRNTIGQGIGTFISPTLILTSAHTLAGASDITVSTYLGGMTNTSRRGGIGWRAVTPARETVRLAPGWDKSSWLRSDLR